MNLKRVLPSLLFTFGFMVLALVPSAQSPPPDRINYQGVLRDSAGAPLNGPITMTFSFYDAASGGTLLWEEIYDSVVYPPQVTVSGGLFTAALGDSAHRNGGAEPAFAGVFSNRAEVYLAVTVDTDSEMTPRVRVVSAAYSINSGTLDGREAASFASATHLHAGGDITSGTLDDARLSSGVAHLGVAETIAGNWINTAHPWDDSEVTDKLTVDASGSVADGALSATVANLNAVETIGANWVNAASPWADNEVADVLTLGAGSTIDASIDVGNADTLDGNDGNYYAKATHYHSTLTAGTGLGGGTYDGTAAATFAVQYGTVSGTAVQGNQTAKITAGTGLTGGIPSDALGDGFSATLDVGAGSGITVAADAVSLGPLTANWNQTGAFDLVLANAGAEILMLEPGGGTDYGTLDMGVLSGAQIYTFNGPGGNVWTAGNDGAGSGLNADLLDGEHSSYFMKSTTDDWVNIAGDTMTGKLNLRMSLTTGAGLNLGSGFQPTSPWDGDIWLTTGGLGAYFNGYQAGFLDTTPQSQTKTGKLTLNVSGTALDVTGTSTAAQFAASTPWSNAFLAYSGTGITANGSDKGAIFRDDGLASAYLATSDFGIEAVGILAGAHFGDTDGTSEAHVAYGTEGIRALGTVVGGYFKDSDNSGYAFVGYGNHGIWSFGETSGGYFQDSDSTGYAWVGYGDLGIDARGNTAGGHFQDRSTNSYGYIGYENYGVEGHGPTSGAYFAEDDSGGRAEAWIGRLLSTEYWGIRAFGDTGGGYFIDSTSSVIGRAGYETYSFNGTGAKSFIQNHPYDPGKVVVYAAPEGDEVATYTRGSARLLSGEARVKLGPTFSWVTNPDIGLTAHLTPRGTWADLYVASLSTTDLVVKSKDPGATDISFDYLVYGLRIGFEESSIVQNKKEESYIPAMTSHRNLYASQPDLRAYNALERFKEMRADIGINGTLDLSDAVALKNAIHEFDPAVDTIPGEYDQNPAATSPTSKTPLQGSSDALLPSTAKARNRQPAPMPATAPALNDDLPTGTPAPAIAASVSAFAVKEAVERGDILVLNPANGDELYRCQQASDPMVVGISASDAKASGEVPVFQYGTTWVRVDAHYGPIARGDLLVTSATPGHAMKAIHPALGTVIGKALEPLPSGTGLIKVLVMLR